MDTNELTNINVSRDDKTEQEFRAGIRRLNFTRTESVNTRKRYLLIQLQANFLKKIQSFALTKQEESGNTAAANVYRKPICKYFTLLRCPFALLFQRQPPPSSAR